jgi:hypothetical protein
MAKIGCSMAQPGTSTGCLVQANVSDELLYLPNVRAHLAVSPPMTVP